jgi:hypothetical protein
MSYQFCLSGTCWVFIPALHSFFCSMTVLIIVVVTIVLPPGSRPPFFFGGTTKQTQFFMNGFVEPSASSVEKMTLF